MEQKEWETIEDDIAALEEAIADLEQQMQDSARDYTALNGIIKEKRKKKLFWKKDGPLDVSERSGGENRSAGGCTQIGTFGTESAV